MATGANPSELLTTSLAALSKSAYQAFAEIENRARSEVARASADASAARAERDRAKELLHTSQLESHSSKQEILTCKAALKQAEITIAHHIETIAQLQRETNQWKDQARNWQEHFLRVEQERCVLSTRIAELVAEQIRWNRTGVNPPSTPNEPFSSTIDSAPSSTTTKRASTSSLNQPPAYKSIRPASSPVPESPSVSTSMGMHKPPRSTKPTRRSKNAQLSGELPPYEVSATSIKVPKNQSVSTNNSAVPEQAPRQTLIRRVRAVVHVKQEDSDYGSIEPDSKEDETGNVDYQTKSRITRPRKRKLAIRDDEDYISGEDMDDSGEQDARSDHSDHFDSEEEDRGDGSLDEDDELMMGVEENHHELYGTSRVKNSSKHNPSPKDPPLLTKKRKLAVTTANTREKLSNKKKI